MKACKHYAILLIIIFKRKLSLLPQTVANIFTLKPTAAAASKEKIILTTWLLVRQEVHTSSIGIDMHAHSDTASGPNLP